MQIFKNAEFGSVRSITVNGEPYFVGKDVAGILGYSNTRKALADHVDEEDKMDGVTIRDSIGRDQNPVCINESGLYSLVIASKLPTAKKFKHWITKDVLPSIRRHGAYMTDSTLEQALTSPDFLIQLATKLKEEKEARKALEEKIDQDKPKVLFADAVTSSKTSILIGDLAKILKQNGFVTGQKRLFEQLRQEGYLIKNGSVRVTRTTKVTGKGQQYFINHYLCEQR